MGMDLIPENELIEGFYANWAGWRYIRDVLELAGADITKMAECHDGDFVDKKTAKAWGEAVLQVLPYLYELYVPNKFYQGEYYAVPVLAKNMAELVEIALTVGEPHRLGEDTKSWLKEFAEFCINSKGFYQY